MRWFSLPVQCRVYKQAFCSVILLYCVWHFHRIVALHRSIFFTCCKEVFSRTGRRNHKVNVLKNKIYTAASTSIEVSSTLEVLLIFFYTLLFLNQVISSQALHHTRLPGKAWRVPSAVVNTYQVLQDNVCSISCHWAGKCKKTLAQRHRKAI